jgi:hypothetical protein
MTPRVCGEAKDVEEAVSGVGCLDGAVIVPLLKDTFDNEEPDGGGGDGPMGPSRGSIPAALSAWLKFDLTLWTLPPPPPAALASSFSKYSK